MSHPITYFPPASRLENKFRVANTSSNKARFMSQTLLKKVAP